MHVAKKRIDINKQRESVLHQIKFISSRACKIEIHAG